MKDEDAPSFTLKIPNILTSETNMASRILNKK